MTRRSRAEFTTLTNAVARERMTPKETPPLPATPAPTCPVCGHPVRVISADEGTAHYEPIEVAATARVLGPMSAVKVLSWLHERVAALAEAPARPPVRPECGAPANDGPCVLPRGHNMGRADVPENHSARLAEENR